jgi:hypothetical protein
MFRGYLRGFFMALALSSPRLKFNRRVPPFASKASAVQNDFGWAAVGAFIGALVTGLFGWLVQRSKSETDHEVAILAEWSKLNKGLADRLSEVERECAEMRKDHAAEIESVRRDHAIEIESIRRDHAREMEDMRKKHRTEMRGQRELNEGLQRMIAQNSQSAAQLLSDSPVTQPKADE